MAVDKFFSRRDHTGRQNARAPFMELESWLRSLGLEQYEAAFRENSIDEKVLIRLTADDLKELGVAAVGRAGHRRTLLDAIAALRASAELRPRIPSRFCTRQGVRFR